MKNFLIYLFWPNPGNAGYDSPKAIALIVVCALLMVAAVGISLWRKRASQGMRRVSKPWASASFWFGFVGLVLVVSRVEQIQYVSMRFLWVLWLAALLLFGFFQMRTYRARHYEVLKSEPIDDPRSKYLPKQKKRR